MGSTSGEDCSTSNRNLSISSGNGYSSEDDSSDDGNELSIADDPINEEEQLDEESDEDSDAAGSFGSNAILQKFNDFSAPPSKKPRMELSTYNYSDKSMRMMANMGYDKNAGLGKKGQGRIEPIIASEQKGRRGLGLKCDGLDEAAGKFDQTTEHVLMREPHAWVHSGDSDLDDLSFDVLEQWIVVGYRKLTIDDESKFCDPQILADVLSSKSIFDNLGADDMRKARTRSNPFETIRGAIFLNRAAVKMANMDSIFDFMFTNPIDEYGGPLVREDELLYFADVCAGPGGFSEYVLWRKGWQAKGFGFTLRKENDFKLHDFHAGFSETFDAYYGVKGDGNVFDPENIESLTAYVLKQTQDVGVHFMMADGGFSVEGQENVQEILSKQLYLCQCIVALSIVREKGHFVVKMFDLFTPFSVGLVYLMYKCFQQICIFKPNTSRPANSERYLICKWKKPNTDTIRNHLCLINKVMFENASSDTDTLELVPYHVLKEDEKFFEYIYESNNTIGQNQIAGLLKIAAYCKDTTLLETRQAQIREDCLSIWKLPNAMRTAPPNLTDDQMCRELLGSWYNEKNFLLDADKMLTCSPPLKNIFIKLNSWYFVPIDNENSLKYVRTFFMSKGGQNVLMYTPGGNWVPLRDIYLELTPKTLIYGEIVKELSGEGMAQKIIYSLHIIDGMVLGGMDIRKFSIKKRLQMCKKFATALNKPLKVFNHHGNQAYIAPIHCKKLYKLSEFRDFFDRLNHYKLKDGKRRLGLSVQNTDGADRFYVPRGLIFFNELKPNLTREISTKHNTEYFYDHAQKRSFYEHELPDPSLVYASFKSSFITRKIWAFQVEDQVSETFDVENCREGQLLYRVDFDNYIMNEICPKF